MPTKPNPVYQAKKQHVIDSLVEAIETGVYSFGDSLPKGDDLMTIYDASSWCIVEARKALKAGGYVADHYSADGKRSTIVIWEGKL